MQIPGYRIERELGQGGMAIVYLALQQSLHRRVALKVIKPILTTDEEFAQRFMHEGRTIAQLADPHIVTVYDIASHQGTYYLSMEYLPGGSLQERIRNGMNVSEVLSIAKAVLSALQCAHQHQVVHRDIKPQNILFRDNGQPVLTDFGISKTLGASTVMTGTGLSLGTPRYMSPEQIRGQGVDARSDLYSFGVMLYEMLTGQVPYHADDSFALAMMHVTAPVPLLPSPLSRFQALLNVLLDKDPARRLQSAAQVSEALDASAAGKFTAPQRAARSRRRRWQFGSAAAVILVAAASSYLLLPDMLPDTDATVELPDAAPPPQVAIPPHSASTVAAEEQRQIHLQAEQFLEQAQLAQQGGSLQMALVHIEQGLQAAPHHPELLRLQQIVLGQQQAIQQRQEEAVRQQQAAAERQQQAEIERQQQAEAARRRAKEAIAQREFEAMQRARDEALRQQAAAEQRLRQAAAQRQIEAEQRQLQADQLLVKALESHSRQAYAASLASVEQGLRQVPNHSGLLALRQQLREQLHPAPQLVAPPAADAATRLASQLRQCAVHLKANRLTSGKGGNAADCYRNVLRHDSENAEAQAGLEQIATHYAQTAANALQRRDKKGARTALRSLEQLHPDHWQLAELRAHLAELEMPKTPPPKEPVAAAAPTMSQPAAPAINLLSVPQAADVPAETPKAPSKSSKPETRVLAEDRHTRISQTKADDDVSLQVTTSPQGMLDESGRAATKKAAPANLPAQLLVRCDVEDAEVWVNNRKVGTTPLQVEIQPGSYRVRIHAEGYSDWNGKVDLAPGDESSINAVLPKKIAKTAAERKPEERKPEVVPADVAEEEEKPAPARPQAAPGQSPNCVSGNCSDGRGTYHYPDGSQYSGDFRNSKMHGSGTYTYAGRGEKYVGEWRNGVINGHGVYHYRTGNSYEGAWRNGRKHGQGTYIYADRGEKYVGQFANDQPNGQGTYYYGDGDRYDGEWRNGRKHGHGVMYEDGRRVVGEWRNDQKVSVATEEE